MPSVYVETTIPSYLTARRSQKLITAAHQEITHRWWEEEAGKHDLFVSPAVLDEVRRGNPGMAERRLAVIKSIPVLTLTEPVGRLIDFYVKVLGLPPKARVDVAHIAFAAAHRIDYLLTWNCAHIANGAVIRKLAAVNAAQSLWTPTIVTPDELMNS